MKPCDCKTTEDVNKLKYNIYRPGKTIHATMLIVQPDYVTLLSNTTMEISRKEFKALAEFFLKDQG